MLWFSAVDLSLLVKNYKWIKADRCKVSPMANSVTLLQPCFKAKIKILILLHPFFVVHALQS